jgi:hypothetical protein
LDDILSAMNEVIQLLLLVALAGAGVTLAGTLALWLWDETRRIRRALTRVLGAEVEIMLVARGRGRGAGVSFATGLCAVGWDSGAWCLVYGIDELMGAELIIDGQVVGRAFRGEPRRALEQLVTDASRVTLRLVFDDPHHPDFDLDLWVAGDERRRANAVQEANTWLARAEAILRRPVSPKVPPATPVQPPRDEAPPWDDAFDDEDEPR